MSSALTLPVRDTPDAFTRAHFSCKLPASADVVVVGAGIAGPANAPLDPCDWPR